MKILLLYSQFPSKVEKWMYTCGSGIVGKRAYFTLEGSTPSLLEPRAALVGLISNCIWILKLLFKKNYTILIKSDVPCAIVEFWSNNNLLLKYYTLVIFYTSVSHTNTNNLTAFRQHLRLPSDELVFHDKARWPKLIFLNFRNIYAILLYLKL